MPETKPKPRKASAKQKAAEPSNPPVEAAKPPKMGRPTKYSNDLAIEICVRLANGKSIVQITKEDDMPSQSTIYVWLREREDFQQMYARARDDQIDTNVDEIIAIADEMPPSYTDKDGRTTLDTSWINWQKNRIDARKWSAVKLKPRKYGERVGLEGVEGGPPITTEDLTSGRMFELMRNLEMKIRAGTS